MTDAERMVEDSARKRSKPRVPKSIFSGDPGQQRFIKSASHNGSNLDSGLFWGMFCAPSPIASSIENRSVCQ